MVSVLLEELEYKVEKRKYKTFQVKQPRIRTKCDLPLVNKPSRIGPHESFTVVIEEQLGEERGAY